MNYAVAASDGSPLFYESWGERGANAPVLLCDGIGCDGYVWRYLRQDLTDRFGVHPHYRGHGRTAAPRDPQRVTIEDLADDVASVLDDALVERAVLIGHSMGVQVALETYRRHPDRVSGLVLVCGSPAHPLKTFRGSAALEDLLPTIQRWIHRVPGVINRVTRTLLPTRLAYEVASRLEIRRELVEPRDFMPYLEGMSRIDSRLFVAMLSSSRPSLLRVNGMASRRQSAAGRWRRRSRVPSCSRSSRHRIRRRSSARISSTPRFAILWPVESTWPTLFLGSEKRVPRSLGSLEPVLRYHRVNSEHESFYTFLSVFFLSVSAWNFVAFQKLIGQGRGPSHRVPWGENREIRCETRTKKPWKPTSQ
jgi:pimeloyl-ACP methyl ester carboxylesterase